MNISDTTAPIVIIVDTIRVVPEPPPERKLPEYEFRAGKAYDPHDWFKKVRAADHEG